MSEELLAAATPVAGDAMIPPMRRGSPRGETWRRLWRKPRFLLSCAVVLLLVVISIFPAFFAGFFGNGDPTYCDLSQSVAPPTSGHPFGFDIQGCDVYANVIYGARASLSVGFIATGAALIIAVIIGSVAGLYGGWTDSVISRLTDIFLGFPFLLGAVVVLTSLHSHSVVVVGLVLALFGWPTLARLMRAQVRTVRDAEYVVAARGLGASTGRILRKHILPNTLAPVLAITSVSVGGVLVAEASLTFLGIGLRPPTISWGLQLAAAQTQFGEHPHLLIFPGLFLSITVLALITAGDAIRDAFDPRSS
jgi:ABC-type dipeptide/oligopeptide/nickel transport system permease subunit